MGVKRILGIVLVLAGICLLVVSISTRFLFIQGQQIFYVNGGVDENPLLIEDVRLEAPSIINEYRLSFVVYKQYEPTTDFYWGIVTVINANNKRVFVDDFGPASARGLIVNVKETGLHNVHIEVWYEYWPSAEYAPQIGDVFMYKFWNPFLIVVPILAVLAIVFLLYDVIRPSSATNI